MGCGSSILKQEVDTLQKEILRIKEENQWQKNKLNKEKQNLELKIKILEEMAATAQVEAERKTKEADISEKRADAMKWELTRALSPKSNSPRHRMSWKMKEDNSFHRLISPSNQSNQIPHKEDAPLSDEGLFVELKHDRNKKNNVK